ncbi:MAG: hypothetical protein P8N76_01400 [Pirellulaceae bacterium]|nr:hypothetical protein [Pirellulaceae bacterium]
MTQEPKAPITGWRRHAMGTSALILLVAGCAFFVWPVGGDSGELVQGSLIKSGLALGAAWLAFPQLDRLPGWIFVSLIGILLAIAIRPRIFMALSRYLIVLAPLLFVIWLLRRIQFSDTKNR